MKQTRRFLALLLALCLSWSQISPALAVALDEEQTEPVVVAEETVAPEVPETEAATEAPEVIETEAPVEEPEVIETEVAEEEVVAEEAANEGEPVGTRGNPEPMTLGKNTVTFTPDSDFVRYYFSWEAPAEGLLTVVVDTDLPEWDFYCENDAGFRYFRLDEDNDPASAGARVSAGDKLKLEVYAGIDEDGNIRSGTFTFTASFDDNVGTKELPVRLDANNAEWNEDKSVGTMIVTAPVGTTWYEVYSLDDKIVKVDGVAPPEQDNGRYTTGIFPITNNTDAEKDFVLTFCDAVKGDLPSMAIIMEIWDFTWNADRTVSQGKITLPVGTTWYVTRGNEMNVFVDGVLVYEPTFVQPGPAFSLTNDTGAEKVVSVKCTYPVGIQGNYDTLTLGSHTAEIKEGQYMGYGYRTVVNETTEFTFSIDTSAAEWEYKIWAYGTDNRLQEIKHSSRESAIVDTVNFTVGAGNPLIVTVGTKLNQGTASAGTISFELKEAPKPGDSAENPIEINDWVWNEIHTAATTTVTAPVGTTWYASYGIGGMELTINDGTPVLLSGNPRMPSVFSITNNGEAAAEYSLKVAYAAGSQANPVVLDELIGGEVSLPANSQGYYYNYTVADTGTYTFYIGSITEGVEGDIIITNKSTSVQKSLFYDGVDNYGLEVSMDVTAGDELEIIVAVLPDASWNYPAADISWVANFAYPVGSEQNPIMPEFQWNEEYTEATATVTVPAGTTYHFAAYASGMMLTINDGEPQLLVAQGMGRVPAYFTITNDGEEAAEYTLKLTYPMGSMQNPEVLYGRYESTVSIEANDFDGYYYTYTADATGTLEFFITEITEGVEADIVVASGYSYKSLQEEGVDGILSVPVTEGDELNIQVVVLPDENYTYPAADITWNFNFPVGSELNPVMPEFQWNEEYTEATATVTVPAGTTYHFAAYASGMMLTINDGEPQLLVAQGMGRVPAYFTITNDGEEAAEYTLKLTYPMGTMQNPEVLYGCYESTVSIEANDFDGYYYTYTVDAAGTLEFSVVGITEGVEADIVVASGYSYKSLQEEGVDGILSVPVNEGDELNIQVVILPDEYYNYPAGEVTWTFGYPAGSEQNPIMPEFQWNEEYTEATAAVTVPAGTTYHFAAYASGMMLTINDGEPQLLKAEGIGRVPAYFTITNDGEEAAEYTLKLTYPVGKRENPAELQLADEYSPEIINVATLEEGNWDGYVFGWTAPEAGELTITMHNGKAGWNYSIMNMTTYASTDMHASADVPAVPSETITVNAGDEIMIMVNTCGADIYDVTPAGEVYFTAEYVMALGIEANPILPEWIWNETETEATATFTAPVGTTYYGITVGDMFMSVNGGEPVAVNGSRWAPEVHAYENTTEEPVEVTLHIWSQEGTSSNPAVINEGTTTAELTEGSSGLFYAFIAPDRGEVTVTINTETGWQYFVNNATSYIYGETHWCDDEIIVTTETVSVNKGDKVVICVNTYNPEDPWGTTPAGSVSFDVAFAAAEGTENNPIMIYDASQSFNGEIPANTTVYFSAYGIGGMFLDLYAADALVLELNGETFTADKYGWINTQIPASPMGGRMPVSFAITNVTAEPTFYEMGFYHPYGSMGNPAQLNIGKNEAPVEENDTDGYVYHWFSEKDGYLTITMTGKVWSYTLNNYGSNIYGDNHSSTDDTVVKSQTIKVNAYDDIELIVNTPFSYDTFTSPAGTVKFTAAFASTQYELLSGKSMTLKFTDPATGKAVSASKATWEITSGAEFATLKGAKLTANKGITEASEVVVTATSGENVNTFVVTIYPAVEEVKIIDKDGNDLTGDTLYMYANDFENYGYYLELFTQTAPGNAMKEVVWKSSNTKILTTMGSVMSPVWNEKTQAYNAGKVTLTATAVDGSGKKASVQVVVSNLVNFLEITDKKNEIVNEIGSGKSIQLKANTNPDATNKKVTWEIVEGAEFAKITASGKLTANKGLTTAQTVLVKATAQDAGAAEATLYVTITPVANKVVIVPDYNVVEGKFDMNSYWPAFYLTAEVYTAGDAEGIPTASQNVTWKSSNTKIATIDANGEVYCNKPGTVTFTATATDGSNKKATLKVTIIKSISYIEMQPEAIVAGGKSLTLKPAIYDADATNKKLTWSMTMADGSEVAKSVATLSKTGKLTTKKTSEVVNLIVTCTANDGSYASASCNVTIYPATTKVTIMQYGAAIKGTQAMTVGEEKVFYAACEPGNAADQYTWKSSNEKIARIEVNADGSVTIIAVGEKTGNVTITATAIDGTNKKATMKIKVTPAE